MRGDELLLLADRAQKAECVHAKADHRDHRHGQQRGGCAERHAYAFAGTWRREDQERECQPCGQLDAHSSRQGAGART